MSAYFDLCKETTTSTGTGNITTAGAVTGFRTIASAAAIGERVEYRIDGGTEQETGVGYLSAATTFVRETVYYSTNGNALVNFSAGTKTIFITVLGASATRMRRMANLVQRATFR